MTKSFPRLRKTFCIFQKWALESFNFVGLSFHFPQKEKLLQKKQRGIWNKSEIPNLWNSPVFIIFPWGIISKVGNKRPRSGAQRLFFKEKTIVQRLIETHKHIGNTQSGSVTFDLTLNGESCLPSLVKSSMGTPTHKHWNKTFFQRNYIIDSHRLAIHTISQAKNREQSRSCSCGPSPKDRFPSCSPRKRPSRTMRLPFASSERNVFQSWSYHNWFVCFGGSAPLVIKHMVPTGWLQSRTGHFDCLFSQGCPATLQTNRGLVFRLVPDWDLEKVLQIWEHLKRGPQFKSFDSPKWPFFMFSLFFPFPLSHRQNPRFTLIFGMIGG
jgi:hypothetical protein